MSTTADAIPKDKWRTYFQEVAKTHEGWAVSIELLARELGDQHAADGLPFQGISYDTEGSQAGDILIETGDAGTPFETHLVHRPCVVRTAPTQPGAEMDIEIEDESGVITLVRLRRRPELPPPGGPETASRPSGSSKRSETSSRSTRR